MLQHADRFGTQIACITRGKTRSSQRPKETSDEIHSRSFLSLHQEHRHRPEKDLREGPSRAQQSAAVASRGRCRTHEQSIAYPPQPALSPAAGRSVSRRKTQERTRWIFKTMTRRA